MAHPDPDPAPPGDDAPDGPLLPDATRPPRRRVTFDEYLRFERRHPLRHEYVDGYVYAMTGAKLRHNRICGNVFAHLYEPVAEHGCQVYVEGVKLRVRDDVFYPDVMVVCAPHGEDDELTDAPCLLVEVLSPKTMRRDRSEKLEKYRTIPTLRSYLIVAQRERHVVRHWRAAVDAPWQSEELADTGAIALPCPVGTVLTLDRIYRGLAVQPPRLRRVRERLQERAPERARR